jgi:hypothetical protein
MFIIQTVAADAKHPNEELKMKNEELWKRL